MRPMLHARLVNGRFGDPALFLEMLHRREALLFDAGDLGALSARDLLRVRHLFVTHMHMDHFVGFDSLLRVNVGRAQTIGIITPPGGCARIEHKLHAYDWDLAERYENDLAFEVTEVGREGPETTARFRFKQRFARETLPVPNNWNDVAGLKLTTALLEHHGPCLGFAVSEPAHVNIWKTRLEERRLPIGKWLQDLKGAIVAKKADDWMIHIAPGDDRPLCDLRDLVTVSRGQKIAYVTDVADTADNRAAIAELAAGADLFFLEARFASDAAYLARQRAHLTTRASGEIARAAAVRRLEPFHFSPRYEGEEERMIAEVQAAFMA